MADPHIEGAPASLTDEQREDVRNILARFGGMVEEKKEEEDNDGDEESSMNKVQEDLLKGALSGVTIEWHDLTSETMRYPFVREICCMMEPYVRDEIEVTPDNFKYMCGLLGVVPHNSSSTLISCGVEQADPITMFHIQVKLQNNGNMIMQRLRFIV